MEIYMKLFITLIGALFILGCSNAAKKNDLKESDKDKLLQTENQETKKEDKKQEPDTMTVEMVPVKDVNTNASPTKTKPEVVILSDVTADTALGWLKNGNIRYKKRLLRGDGQDQQARNKTYKEQRPHAIVLAPSDSRVPPEIIFDQKLGEIAVVRTLATSLDTTVIGSLEHILDQQGPQLLVILSQTPSPIIKKAMANLNGKDLGSASINAIYEDIYPRLRGFAGQPSSLDYRVETRANIKGVARDLMSASQIISSRVNSGQLVIKTALYDLKTGSVEFD